MNHNGRLGGNGWANRRPCPPQTPPTENSGADKENKYKSETHDSPAKAKLHELRPWVQIQSQKPYKAYIEKQREEESLDRHCIPALELGAQLVADRDQIQFQNEEPENSENNNHRRNNDKTTPAWYYDRGLGRSFDRQSARRRNLVTSPPDIIDPPPRFFHYDV
jgi:hypothetical protein